MEKYQIEPYDEKTNRGVVRHVLTRYGHTTKEWMVCLVINRTKLPHADALVEELVKLEGMTSISININQKKYECDPWRKSGDSLGQSLYYGLYSS